MPVTIQLRTFPSGIVDSFSQGEVVVEAHELIVFVRHGSSREVLARYLLEDVARYTVDHSFDL